MARQNNKKRGISLGILFWIACILLVLVVFLFSRSNIQRVLEETKLIEVVSNEIGQGNEGSPEDVPLSPEAGNDTQSETLDSQPGQPTTPTSSTPHAPSQTTENEPAPRKTEPEAAEPEQTQVEAPAIEELPPAQATESASKVRTFSLFFVKPQDDGSIIVEARKRGIRFVDSPLTATIQALIAGPVADDVSKGYLSLIPENSQLISAWVREGTAFLNFNDDFRFNPYGLEGNKAQLQQIIFTATEFPTVEQVQILIEGDYVEYISGDGIYVGSPLKRGSF